MRRGACMAACTASRSRGARSYLTRCPCFDSPGNCKRYSDLLILAGPAQFAQTEVTSSEAGTDGHDCFIGEAAFQDMQRPATVGEQRAAALRFADPRVQSLCHVLLLFLLVQGTFTHKDLRASILLHCWEKPPANSTRDGSPMICVACVCTAS